jgi:hypothetical protein
MNGPIILFEAAPGAMTGSVAVAFTVSGSPLLPPSAPATFSRFVRSFVYDLAA